MIPIDRDTQILSHIYNYCDKIQHTVTRFGTSFDTFSTDADYQDSIAMNLLQIGELVSKLSEDFVKKTSDAISWRNIKGMRNLLAHDYGSANVEIVWKTVIDDLPVLRDFCRPYAEQYRAACEEIAEEEDNSFTQTM